MRRVVLLLVGAAFIAAVLAVDGGSAGLARVNCKGTNPGDQVCTGGGGGHDYYGDGISGGSGGRFTEAKSEEGKSASGGGGGGSAEFGGGGSGVHSTEERGGVGGGPGVPIPPDPCEADPSLPECQPEPCVDPDGEPCSEPPEKEEKEGGTVGEDPVEFASIGFFAPMLIGGCLLAYRTIRSRRQE